MKKRILAVILIFVLSICAFTVPASAEQTTSQAVSLIVNYRGKYFEEKALKTKKDKFMVPVSWIGFYGAMHMTEEEDFYKFYYVGEEEPDSFSKRIYVKQDGSGYDVRYYRKKSDFVGELSALRRWGEGTWEAMSEGDMKKLFEYWKIEWNDWYERNNRGEYYHSFSVLSGKFSKKEIFDGELYLPIEEVLPFLNATVGISKYGEILIEPNCISLSQALDDETVGELSFNAYKDIAYAKELAGTAYIVDTLINFKFIDRTVFKHTADISDYEKLFKSYLTEDETFLKAFDEVGKNDVNPRYEMYNLVADGFETGEAAIQFMDKSYSYMEDMQIPEELFGDEYQVFCKEYGSAKIKGVDIVEGFTKVFDYHRTYNNQVDDHREMLLAVYNYDTIDDASSADYAAAQSIAKLYGDEYADRLIAASDKALRDAIMEATSDYFMTQVGKVKFLPYQIVAAALKETMLKEEFETVYSTAMINYMDEAVSKSADAYFYYKYGDDYSTKRLNKMRLSAIMALVASRDAYSRLWDGDHEKISKIDEALKMLYLAADSVECDSSDYYAKTKSELKSEIKYIKTADEIPEYKLEIDTAYESLIGTWTAEIDGEYGEITFYGDYSGAVEAENFYQEFDWEIHGDFISILTEPSIEIQYSIVGNKLYLTVDDVTHEFTKKYDFLSMFDDEAWELLKKIVEYMVQLIIYVGNAIAEQMFAGT